MINKNDQLPICLGRLILTWFLLIILIHRLLYGFEVAANYPNDVNITITAVVYLYANCTGIGGVGIGH